MKCHDVRSDVSQRIPCLNSGLWRLNLCGGTGRRILDLMPKGISQIFQTRVEVGEMQLLIRHVLLLVVLFVGSCGESNVTQSENPQETMHSEKLSRVENETGLSFPDNSRLVHFSEPFVALDPVWVAKIVMPVSSYDGFRESLLRKPADKTIYDGALADSTNWWKPTNAILTRQFLANSQTFVNVVISQTEEEIAVYIECVVF